MTFIILGPERIQSHHMKIRYLLKRKPSGVNPIYVALYDSNDTQLISTGQACMLKQWDKESRMPKDHDSELFQECERVRNAILRLKRKMDADELPVTPTTLKDAYEENLAQMKSEQHAQDVKSKVGKLAVSSLIDKFIETGMDNYQPGTKRVLITSIRMFQEWIKTNYPRLGQKELDNEIIIEYARYLQEKRKLRDSTHGKKMKHLRWFLKFIKYEPGQIKDVKIRTVKPSERNIIHLTLDELHKLEKVDVSHSVEQQKAKDMFLLGCYTGLRVSDLKRISPHRIKNDEIHMTLQKNRTQVSIPILSETRAILQRYNESAPKISEQQVNESIKDVCQKAEIDTKVFFKTKKAGQLIEKLHPKHELITSHVAGKTFISLAGQRWGLSPVDIAAIVGKDVKTILGYYLKPDLEEAKRKMLEAERRSLMKVV